MTSNRYTVKGSSAFAGKVVEQDSEFFMRSLDVDSLFTNISLEETIHICANTFFQNTEIVEDLSKIESKELLSLATKESYFISNGKLQKQVDGILFFLCTLKRTGYKIVRPTLRLTTTGGMLLISLF